MSWTVLPVVKTYHYLICLVSLTIPFSRPFLSRQTAIRKQSRNHLSMVLEVEQKFRINDNQELIYSKLKDLGFERKCSPKTFTDWYFDVPSLGLSLNDCWFRYRQIGSHGQWQLKRGRESSFSSNSTVYEEIEGREAVEIALSMNDMHSVDPKNDDATTMDIETIIRESESPTLPTERQHSLRPIVRLETTRSSWILSPTSTNAARTLGGLLVSDNLQVDLDTTNINYAVGEVETIVETENQLPEAQAKVQMVVEMLTNGKKGMNELGPPAGKLEHYLFHFRPAHYNALVRAGVLKNVRVEQEDLDGS